MSHVPRAPGRRGARGAQEQTLGDLARGAGGRHEDEEDYENHAACDLLFQIFCFGFLCVQEVLVSALCGRFLAYPLTPDIPVCVLCVCIRI